MRYIQSFLVWVFICMAGSTVSLGQESGAEEALYEWIKNVSLDGTKMAEVDSLVLKRDVAVFRLDKGGICLFQPIKGRVTGAVFVGKGIFEFSPPTEIERYQLKKFTGSEVLREEFNELYLVFTDTTSTELGIRLNFIEGDIPGKFKSIKNDCPKRLLDKTGRNIWFRTLEEMLADSSFSVNHPERSNRFFYAEINGKSLGRLFFTFDPKQVEEVTLEKPTGRTEILESDLICSFHMVDDYSNVDHAIYTPITGELKDEIRTTHYKIDVEIDEQEHMLATAEIDYKALVDGVRVVNFLITGWLKIKEIADGNGDLPWFSWEGGQGYITAILPQPTRAGENGRLIFKYSGHIIDQNWYGDFYIRPTLYWYPQYGYQTRATFDLSFKCPKKYRFISIGKKVKEWEEGDFVCSQWEENYPVYAASFNYGEFDVYKLELKEIPPVSVYYLEDSRRRIRQDYNRLLGKYLKADILILDSKSKEHIGADVVNSLNFFQSILGKYPFSKMEVIEIPDSRGQGFPGLINLSLFTFLGDGEVDDIKLNNESFRAHEVSHQWWGHIVGCKTYHDLWLSEGFAAYSGLWYGQMSLKNNQSFFEELEQWRKDILGKGYVESEGSKAGPIWLGPRLFSSKSYDYDVLVYEKGGYILHMLRNMMMDYNTKSDSSFIALLHAFVDKFYGKEASTEDFKEEVENQMGENMDWFFEQWVYGTEIPTYEFSYNTEQTYEGKSIVTCEITQKNVSEDFKMLVPVLLDFGSEMYAIEKIWIDKPKGKYSLPISPLNPRRVILNPFHAVLCEVKNK